MTTELPPLSTESLEFKLILAEVKVYHSSDPDRFMNYFLEASRLVQEHTFGPGAH